MKTRNAFTQLLGVLTLIATLASCALFSGRETPGEYVDDGTITSEVKVAILNDASLKVLQINVETMQGVVQLSGFVDSIESEMRALKIARHIHGVKAVDDNLIVR